MTRRSISLLGVLAASWWIAAPTGWTHRLDECLQAMRVNVATDRLTLDLDLTPGASVAGQVLALLDLDADGEISATESVDYARRLLRDVAVTLDGRGLSLHVVSADASPLAHLKSGDGRLRIRAHAGWDALGTGTHVLDLTNRHLPSISVYLVNATKPADPALLLGRQVRNPHQSEYRLEFTITRQDATDPSPP
ncbi:MAG: hypothetical protein JNK85_24265 [Verrucomicrobiales bacterium]|nr:hypothetical protein [Verrucomicrobiales bacterium]